MIRLDATMRELDRAAEAAWTPKTADVIPADVAVRYLREATVHLTEHAVRHGIAAALPEEVGISVSGRGERNCAVISDAGAIVRFVRRGRTDVGAISA
jgi:hypothetical protein